MYGEVTQTVGTLASDFQYAGYYFHAPSGLNLTTYRAYNPSLGRWINRDPIGENGGINLYAYVVNMPPVMRDPYGLNGLGGGFAATGDAGAGMGAGGAVSGTGDVCDLKGPFDTFSFGFSFGKRFVSPTLTIQYAQSGSIGFGAMHFGFSA